MRPQTRNSVLIVFLFLFLAVCTAKASSVIDTLNTLSGPAATNGAALTQFSTLGTAGGVGFTTGYDQANSAVAVVRTNDLAVSLVNYVSGQNNSSNHWSIAATTATVGIARRAKIRDVTPLSGTIWFSFLASLQNVNGDVALTFNGAITSGSFNTTPGMRVGLGNPAKPGALGIGSVASQANLATITNGVNGAITGNGVVPTDGTAVLVLGRISSENGFPKMEIWLNPDVANEAGLPAPTLSFLDSNAAFVQPTISRIGYQVVRSASGIQNEVIDNVKISDELNGFDIVYKNTPLPLPLLNVALTNPGNETGPGHIAFSVTSDRVVVSPLTVTYRLSGIATNGFNGSTFVDSDFMDPNFNTDTQTGSFTIPAGQSNTVVNLAVIDDSIPEGEESVTLTIDQSSEYILGNGSATAPILENNDANVSLQYMFTRTVVPQIWDTNITASSFNASRVGGGYSTSAGYFISPDASIRANGNLTADTQEAAITGNDYMSFFVSPVLGKGLAITQLELQAMYGNFLFQDPNAAAAVIFVRSSLDNFASDLASWTLQPDNVLFPNAWYNFSLPLTDAFTNLIGGIEFRFYIYDDTSVNQVGVRVDNVYLRGSTFPAVGAQQVSVSTNIFNAAEPASAGSFKIERAGSTAAPLTVNYSISGTAINGVDYTLLTGAAVIPAGQTNVLVTVTPIDDELIESAETVTLTLTSDPNYGVVATSSGTLDLNDDADVGGLVGYLFNEANNGAASLSAIAAASTKQPDKVSALNATAGPSFGAFGANLTAGVGHGYATSASHSAPATLYIRGEYLAKNAIDAVAQSNYVSFVVSPQPGFALTFTNFTAYLKMIGTPEETTWVFLRSSIDNFAADLTSTNILGTPSADPFHLWSGPLNIQNRAESVEFRVYFYNNTSTIIRLDDVAFQGFASAAAIRPNITGVSKTGSTVTINFSGAVADTASDYKLQSAATVTGSFADDDTAILSGSAGSFQATTQVNGALRFYRIRR